MGHICCVCVCELVQGIYHDSRWIQWIIRCGLRRVVLGFVCDWVHRWCTLCMVVIWRGIDMVLACIYIEETNQKLFVLVDGWVSDPRWSRWRTECFYWLVRFGQWGELLYCVLRFVSLWGMDVRMWIVGVAMYPYHWCGIVCSWGFGIWVAKICFSYDCPYIGHI